MVEMEANSSMASNKVQAYLTQAMETDRGITSRETILKINKGMAVVELAILSTKEEIMEALMDIRVNINRSLTIMKIKADHLKEHLNAKIKTLTPIIRVATLEETAFNQKVSIIVGVHIKSQIMDIRIMEAVAEDTRIKATIMVEEEAIKSQVAFKRIITTMAVAKSLGKRNLSVAEATRTTTIMDLLSTSKMTVKNLKSLINSMEVAKTNIKEVDIKNLLIKQKKMEAIREITTPINRMGDTNRHLK